MCHDPFSSLVSSRFFFGHRQDFNQLVFVTCSGCDENLFLWYGVVSLPSQLVFLLHEPVSL